jgi:hypothetical protein
MKSKKKEAVQSRQVIHNWEDFGQIVQMLHFIFICKMRLCLDHQLLRHSTVIALAKDSMQYLVLSTYCEYLLTTILRI